MLALTARTHTPYHDEGLVLIPLRLPRVLSATCAVALPTAGAHACTVCNSRAGHQLRAGLFDGHFLHTLLIVLAPFPIFAASVLLLHLGMPHLTEPGTQRRPSLLPGSEPVL